MSVAFVVVVVVDTFVPLARDYHSQGGLLSGYTLTVKKKEKTLLEANDLFSHHKKVR